MTETKAPSATPEQDAANEATQSSPRSTFGTVKFSLLRWWMRDVVGTVNQAEVIEKRREDCLLTARYMFMTAMSAGIAVLGLLLSSPAVVIGAMLLSPLMGPIMGLGFALAIGDYHWLKQSARSLAWGTAMAIGLTALLVFFSPIQTITPEIAARTQPNLFDLFVALFSALAGAYAMIRGREGTIVGVAIATALMPPLATVGFGLATWNWTVFSGSLMLYVTNLITIALTAWAMARLYGFKTEMSARNTLFQNFAVASVFILLAIPLALSLQQIAFQTNAQRVIRAEIEEAFVPDAEISRLEVEFRGEPIIASATVYTPVLNPDAEVEVERALANRLGEPVELTITQFQVGTSASAAEAAQLSAARASEEAAAIARADDLAQRLALVAGVSEDDVVIDRTRRRAVVRAERLEGATLAAYKALEERIAATEPDWTIELLPPAAALPDVVTFGEDGPTLEGTQALSVIEWAASRTDIPIVLTGNRVEVENAAEILRERGAEIGVQVTSGPVRAQWGRPEGS
ncbi:TIGR00341 family protein [Erythrobacter sp. THAF29]|uniref:TIGR00341 family protein n=1 Tax=Erythrobacter sp. THAF29 TaxID=2587851 RepID=UPI001F403CBC|nr:TIGR00341 family protein [Erythrobacter sp. THAF29]